MMKRNGNTGREMVENGVWVKVGRKHYQHITGAEVRYDCNRWGWEVVGKNELYTVLWAAKHRAERIGLDAMPTQGVQ